jgi:hypothetical protein
VIPKGPVWTQALRGAVLATLFLSAPISLAQEASDSEVVPQGPQRRVEPSVAVDPRDPRRVLVGAIDGNRPRAGDAAYLSTDGGRTFESLFFVPHGGGSVRETDPSVAFDRRGRALYAYPALGEPLVESAGGLYVIHSRPGARDWDLRPVAVARNRIREDGTCIFHDRSYVTADAWRDFVYVTWQKLWESGEDCGTIDKEHIMVVRSRDGGRTFSKPTRVSRPGSRANFVASPGVAPNGDLFVVYKNDDSDSTCPQTEDVAMTVARSSDRGRTFTHRVVSTTCDIPGTTPGAAYRQGGGPVLAIDPQDGTIVVVWAAYAQPGQVIELWRSHDQGRTWTAGRTIGDPTTVHQFPWIAFGPDGRLYLVSIQAHPGGTFDVYLRVSTDEGSSWSEEMRVTSASSFPGNHFVGDYIGLAVGSDHVAHPVWTDVRSFPDQPNIWSRALSFDR